jgi:hypothetical protein
MGKVEALLQDLVCAWACGLEMAKKPFNFLFIEMSFSIEG